MLTDAEYAKFKTCPKCQCYELHSDGENTAGSSDDMVFKYRCGGCGATWNAVYKLTHYRDFKENESS